jgi:hypothetical protein
MDDLAWKRDKMRRATAEAAKAVESIGNEAPAPAQPVQEARPRPVLMPYSESDSAFTASPGANLGTRQPDIFPDSPAAAATKGGGMEALHAAGDIFDSATAGLMLAGRKAGRAFNPNILAGALIPGGAGVGMKAYDALAPGFTEAEALRQQHKEAYDKRYNRPGEQGDVAGAVSDTLAPISRVVARATGDVGEGPNDRTGLTGTIVKEVIESGRLAADPNASAGERIAGGIGAVTGAGSVFLGGGAPAGLNPGKLVSKGIDAANTQRILAGQRHLPNPSFGGLLEGLRGGADTAAETRTVARQPRGALFFDGAAKTPDEYYRRAAAEIMEKFKKAAKDSDFSKLGYGTISQVQDATASKIAEALRSPKANPDLHKAIKEVYAYTSKDMAADLGRLGRAEVSNKGDTTAPPPETRPSVEEKIAEITQRYGVKPDSNEMKVGPSVAERVQAARDPDLDKVDASGIIAADKAIDGTPDGASVGEEVMKGVLGGDKPAKVAKKQMAGFPEVEGVAEVRKSPDHQFNGEKLVKLANGDVHPIYFDRASGGYYHAEHVNDGSLRGFIGHNKEEVLERLVKGAAAGEWKPRGATAKPAAEMPKVPEAPKSADEVTENVLSGKAAAKTKVPSDRIKKNQLQPEPQPEVPPPPAPEPKAKIPSDRIKKNQVKPEPPPTPEVKVTPLRPTGFKGDATAGSIDSTMATTNGMVGPSRYFTARKPQPKTAPGASSGTTAQPQPVAQQPQYVTSPTDPFAQMPGSNFKGDTPTSGGGPASIIDRPPPSAVGDTGVTGGKHIGDVVPPGHPPEPPPDPRTQPVPWTRNEDIFNKEFSVGQGTGFLNSDNQMERLLYKGKAAMDTAKKDPLRQVEPASLEALEEADARVKTIIKESDRQYGEIGPMVAEAERQLVGKNVLGKRSNEVLDLKGEIPHPEVPGALFTKMTAQLDDAARPAFAAIKPMNAVQGNYLDTVKTGMQYTGQQAAKAGVLMTDAAGNTRFFEGGGDAARMLRHYNPDTLHRMATDTRFADEVFDVILALPENFVNGKQMNRQEAHQMMRNIKGRIDKGEAFEVERQLPLWPDRVKTRSFGTVPTNDFIHHAIPTRGYSGGGIGAVLKNQLRRAAVVQEFGTLGADGKKFRNLIEGPGGLQGKIGRLGEGAEDEFASLIAAVSGNRAQAGYVEMANKMPPNALAKGMKAFFGFAGDLATSMAGLKSIGQPFEIAAEMPGGFMARTGELTKVMRDTAKGITGQAASRLGMRGLGNRIAGGDYRAEMARAGLPVEDMASATLSFIPRLQGEINNLGKAESFVKGATDVFSAPGRILADMVAGNNELVSLMSGNRQAGAYARLAAKGQLKQSDLARLTNNSMSNESIAWLKAQKGKKFEDIDKGELGEFARELGSNIAQRLQRRLANPAFNQKFINDPLLRDHIKFMNYQFTAWRATEDTAKNVKAIWKSSASPADKAKSIADTIGGLGTRLLGTAAGGGVALLVANTVLSREKSDLAKQGILGQIMANIGAANILGTAGIVGDMALGNYANLNTAGSATAKKMRSYASRDGKMDRPNMPDDLAFTGRAMQMAAMTVGAVAGYPVAKVAEAFGGKGKNAPEKMLTDALKVNTGTLNKGLVKQAGGPDMMAKQKAKGGSRSAQDVLIGLRGGGKSGGGVMPAPNKGASAQDVLKALRGGK